MPLAVEVAPANRHDMKLVVATLANVMCAWPEAGKQSRLCLDLGYDYDEVRYIVRFIGLIPMIRGRRDEQAGKRDQGDRARRWVVERTHSWMNRFRRLLVRWEKRADTYRAMLHFACGIITWQAALAK